MSKFKNITIAGGGTLGSQIAWQTAFKGFNTSQQQRRPEAQPVQEKPKNVVGEYIDFEEID